MTTVAYVATYSNGTNNIGGDEEVIKRVLGNFFRLLNFCEGANVGKCLLRNRWEYKREAACDFYLAIVIFIKK